MSHNFPRLVLLCTLIAFGLSACGGDAATTAQTVEGPAYTIGPALTDSSLAMVIDAGTGTDTLYANRFSLQIQNLTRQFPQVMLDPTQAQAIKRDILTQNIRRFVLLEEAKSRGLQPDSGRVDAILAQYKGQFLDEQAYLADLASRGETEADVKQLFADQLCMEKLRVEVSESMPEPAAEDVEQYRAEHAEERKAQHILLLVPEDAADSTRTRVKQLAETVLDSVKSGAEFAELARRHSGDPGSAQAGGELPFFKRGVMVKPFETATFSLEENGTIYPELVETQFGYHIIRLIDRRTDDTMTTEKAMEEYQAVQERDAAKALETGLLEKTTVRINPEIVQVDLEG